MTLIPKPEDTPPAIPMPSRWFQNRGLFSDHFLQARLPEWPEWKDDSGIGALRGVLKSLYDSKKALLPNFSEAQTEKEFIQPVLDLLGYKDSYIVQAPTKSAKQTGRPDYALYPDEAAKNKSYTPSKGIVDYAQCIGVADAKHWDRDLDLSKADSKDTLTNVNPSFQIVSYLTSTQTRWGIVTNGRLWRLYSTRSHVPLRDCYQVDLVQILEQGTEEEIKWFLLFFRKKSLVLSMDSRSFLDRVVEGSNEYAVELEAHIKERAFEVVEYVSRGFAATFPPSELSEDILSRIFDNSLILLYRLLFIFYAEARSLLPLASSASYRDNYSLTHIAFVMNEVASKGQALSSQSTKHYQEIKQLFHMIATGDAGVGIPEYNGGLFDPDQHRFMEDHEIADSFLAPAIQRLAFVPDKKLGKDVTVDYNTLTERHLGSIYEGLLEFKPRIAPIDLVLVKEKGIAKYAPAKNHTEKTVELQKGTLYLTNDKGERKATGSYYTPEHIVSYIVTSTLDPLVKEAQAKVKLLKPQVEAGIAKWEKQKKQNEGKEPLDKYNREISKERERLLEPYLSLKVLDPAMGSGHFLTRATDFLAEAIATDPCVESPGSLSDGSDLVYYRRRVVESCIYGVDFNPLAVELAKLTLWLTTMAKSKPLSFLNHHLRTGNSLIGAWVSDLDEIPKAKKRKGRPFDLSRAPVQLGIFMQVFTNKLRGLLQKRALIAQLSTETLEDVHCKQVWEAEFQRDMERFRILADVWVSTYFENDVDWDQYNALVENLQSADPTWEKLTEKKYLQKSRKLSDRYRFFHWELEFPEVFYNQNGEPRTPRGFDIVVGNPPYDVLEKERSGTNQPHVELAQYLESNPGYYSALGGKVNLFRPFLIQKHRLLRSSGLIGTILPLSIINDFSCSRTRGYMLHEAEIVGVDCFPQKDDPRERVFEDAKLSTCVIILKKPGPTTAFCVRTYAGRFFTVDPKTVQLSLDQIKSIDPDVFPIPLVNQAEWNVAIGIHSRLPIRRLSDVAALTRGEINQTVFAEFITANPAHQEMIKGVEIDRYAEHYFLSQGEKQWFDEESFLKETKSTKDPPSFRIGMQRISGIDETTRLRATFVDRRVYFADSTNSVASVDKSRLHFLLALINSRLFNWRFKLTSTNNNVSTNELDRIPVRSINVVTSENERKPLLQDAWRRYEGYLLGQNWNSVLGLVKEWLVVLPDGTPDVKHEKSDVVRDLLADLSADMCRLNWEKQATVRSFLTWLEKEVLKGSVEDQKNKTRIMDFHNSTFEDFLDVLKKNKVVDDPCTSNTRDTISHEFSIAVNALAPLKSNIVATDKLIDQIVYRLYGLTDEEIAVVEG